MTKKIQYKPEPKYNLSGCRVILHRQWLDDETLLFFEDGRVFEVCYGLINGHRRTHKIIGDIDSIKKKIEELKGALIFPRDGNNITKRELEFYQKSLNDWNKYRKSTSLEGKAGK